MGLAGSDGAQVMKDLCAQNVTDRTDLHSEIKMIFQMRDVSKNERTGTSRSFRRLVK